MKPITKKPLVVTKFISITYLLTLLFTASTRAQTPAIASANSSRDDVTSPTNSLSRSPGALVPTNNALIQADKLLIKQFDSAWRLSGGGSTGRESVVLIFRMYDGAFIGKSQGYTNQYKKFTFKMIPNSVAIVHTHPSSCDPRPSGDDRQVADNYNV